MEEDLDKIASGERQWIPLIRDFYEPFAKLLEEKEGTVTRQSIVALHDIGVDPKSGKPLTVRIGRFGPYVQLGDKDAEEKPLFAPIPKGKDAATLTVDEAMKLFDLPRIVGTTEDGQEILANVGRFGPYLKVGSAFVSLKGDDPYTVDEPRAREVLKEAEEKKANRTIKTFEGSPVQVLNGRYGAYITDGKKNARIPKDIKPEDLTLPACEKLIADAPDKKKRGGFKRKKK